MTYFLYKMFTKKHPENDHKFYIRAHNNQMIIQLNMHNNTCCKIHVIMSKLSSDITIFHFRA